MSLGDPQRWSPSEGGASTSVLGTLMGSQVLLVPLGGSQLLG